MLDVALRAARAGARVLLDGGLARRAAGRKQLGGDYVTAFDRASEDAILEVLAREAPGIPVLAEERGGARDATRWAVDPLDGTTNFTRGLPIVGVSVALIRDGVPEVGAVLAPWMDLTFAGERGRGVTLNGEPLARLDRVDAARAVVATAYPFRRKERLPEYEPVLHEVVRRFEDIRRAGVASLDLAWIASGSFDGYFELSLGTWDVAGGAALVLELGGRVTDWDGGDGYLESGDVMAGAPGVHEALLELAAGRPAPAR
ncbi:MAG TPA: inositol monophosphatase family protein [Candidatus Dormibacteraeota bacterium]|nr:inositol monophosphatase family protein [Candidatus Dormibacteraeota bacterium]